MTVAVGLVHAATAAAYLFLFVVAVGEVRSARRVTSFGAALTLMFLGCGLHHAVHAEHLLAELHRRLPRDAAVGDV